MHPSAMQNCQQFFDCYGSYIDAHANVRVIEIGAQDVNGSLRSTCPPHFEYVGVDFIAAKGVDVVLTDPYALPFEDESADVVMSSSCFEHSEMFWLVFLEIMRVLKPGGLFYLNAPSGGSFHRFPVDCWRFYPDSGRALIAWAKRNGLSPAMLESYVQSGGDWADYVAVFLKDEKLAERYPRRIVQTKQDFANGQVHDSDQILKPSALTDDSRKLVLIRQLIANEIVIR